MFLPYIYLLVAHLFRACLAHSWVERVMKIAFNGTLVGEPGYIRGAIGRDPTSKDEDMQYLLPPHDQRCEPILKESDNLCKATQTIANYSDGFPKLVVNRGDYVALQYQENGHVTLPTRSPQKNSTGYVYVYGTSSPLENEKFLSVHKVWNARGDGGDGRGSLLAKWTFDDGRCYQNNAGEISQYRQAVFRKDTLPPQNNDLWCQIDIGLPRDVEGDYTLYWVWEWPSIPDSQFPSGQPEFYTSCLDIKLLDSPSYEEMAYEEGQDLNFASIEDQVMFPALPLIKSG